MIRTIGNLLRRWRHTRGYGVHSPLAFRIVKECLRPDNRYGFYCDSFIEFEFHEDRKGLRQAKMIIRLLHTLRPKCVWMPEVNPRIVKAIGIAMPGIRVTTNKKPLKNTDFIICHASGKEKAMWHTMKDAEQCGMVIFGQNEDTVEGVTLELAGKDFRIILRRSGMQKVRYEI